MNQQIKITFLGHGLILLCLIMLSGCSSTAKKPYEKRSRNPEKQMGIMRIYLETHEDGIRTQEVQVLRSSPFDVTVDRAPILSEAQMTQVRVVNNEFGFHIEVDFDKRGTWLLESYSATNVGRKFVVMTEFPEQIWMAAPIVRTRIGNGTFSFTPDATVDEANRMAMAVNNSIRKIKNIKAPKKSDSDDSDSQLVREPKIGNRASKS